jgi:hypothetical protein
MSLHFITKEPVTETNKSARSTLAQVDEILSELKRGGVSKHATSQSIVPFIRDIPGCDFAAVVDDDPSKLPQTALRRAIQREPPLHERKPLQFEHFSSMQLEAAFKLQGGGITSEQIRHIEQTREAEKARKRAEKQAKREKKELKRQRTTATTTTTSSTTTGATTTETTTTSTTATTNVTRPL